MRIDWMGPFEGPVCDHRMVRNGLLQDKETENGQMEGRESRVTGVIKKKPTEGQEGRRNHGLFLCWITHLSPLSLILFAFLGGLLFQRETTIYNISNGNATHCHMT